MTTNKVKAIVTFQNDSDIVKKGDSFSVELPNFKAYEPDYTEPNRRHIQQFYGQLADCDCSVVFDFELPAKMRLTDDEVEEHRTTNFFNQREQRNTYPY